MRLGTLLPFLLAATACRIESAPPTRADSAGSRRVLEAHEERLRQAIVGADTAVLAALWAPEYLSTSAVGHTSTRDESLMAYGGGLVRVDSAEVSDLDIRVYGNTAVVLGLQRWGGQAAGRAFSGLARFQHVWLRQRDGTWQLVASQLTGQPTAPPR